MNTAARPAMAAPGVSGALARRIANHLAAGYTPSLKGKRVVLRDVVLVRSDGREAPAAAEVRRQAATFDIPMDISFWDRNAAVERQGNRVFAYDIDGNKHLIAHPRRGQRVVTVAGRRFYAEMPQTQWIVHVPVVLVRTHADGRQTTFNPQTLDLTSEIIHDLFPQGSAEYNLAQMLQTRDGPDAQQQVAQMMSEWTRLITPGKRLDGWRGSLEDDPRVHCEVADLPLTHSVQYSGVTDSGERTIDTFLDQVVFGVPVTSFDLWQKAHLHEASRRTNMQCGVDVIVASASVRTAHKGVNNNKPMFTANEAAQALMTLAKEHFPDSALAKCDVWAQPCMHIRHQQVAKVIVELRNRGTATTDPIKDALLPYVDPMEEFLKKPKPLNEIKDALGKGNIYRKIKLPTSLTKALALRVPWTNDAEHRLLTFFCLYPDRFVPVPTQNSFIAKKYNKVPISEHEFVEPKAASAAIRKHGTPVRLLELFYKKLGVRLVLFQGATCRYVHTPAGWETRADHEKNTVVLNVWNGHVFTYDRAVCNASFNAKTLPKHNELRLAGLRDQDHRFNYEDMQLFSWEALVEAIQEQARGTVFWTTTPLDELFFNGLEDHKISFCPTWLSTTQCKSIYVPLGDKSKTGLRIIRLPENHEHLKLFTDALKSKGVNITYCGESAGVLAHTYMQQLMVRPRRAIAPDVVASLMGEQENRCGGCGDLLRRIEVHHKKPFSQGGGDDIDNLLLMCPPCHAQETERQEQALCRHSVYLESRLSPRMYTMFMQLPLPKQIHWGDRERQAESRKTEGNTVRCLDVVGCRSNFFIERTRPVPIGCPLDQLEPVFDEEGRWRKQLTEFEWLWVDIFEQDDVEIEGFQDAPELHRLYDGPHLYPLETVQFLIEDGFLNANARTLPWGWVPTHRRPAKDLRNAFSRIRETWEELGEEGKILDSWEGTVNDMYKNMVLALIGVWTTQKREYWMAYNTENGQDVPGIVKVRTYSDTRTLSFTSTRTLETRTMLPLALQCKFHEALLVEKAMRILENIPTAIPLAARVDGIYFAAKDMTTLHEVEAHAARHKYAVSERSVYCLKDCKIDNMPMNPQQWGYSIVMGPITRPWRHVHKNDPTFEQIGTSCGIWTEQEDVSYEDKVVKYIMCRRGGLVTGAAGTGKSEILKNYDNNYRQMGSRCIHAHILTRQRASSKG